MALGYQEGFSWKSVAAGAVSGMLAGAAQGIAGLDTSSLGEMFSFAEGAVSAGTCARVAASALMVASAGSKQLIESGKITSWSSLAVAAIAPVRGMKDGEMGVLMEGIGGLGGSDVSALGTALQYTTPWLDVAESYVRTGKVSAETWAGAVGGTINVAIGKSDWTWGKQDVFEDAGVTNGQLATNLMVGGALSAFDKDAAESYLSNVVGNEVGQFIGRKIAGGVQDLIERMNNPPAAATVGVGAASVQGTVGAPAGVPGQSYEFGLEAPTSADNIDLSDQPKGIVEIGMPRMVERGPDTPLEGEDVFHIPPVYVYASDQFMSESRETTRLYWEQVQENAVKERSFGKYLYGKTMGFLGNVGHSVADNVVAMWNDPQSAAVGGAKGLVNLPTDIFDGVVNLTKMSADGWTMIADGALGAFGVDEKFVDFRETDAYNFGHLLEYDNQAEQGGGVFSQLLAPVAAAKLGKLGKLKAGEVVDDLARGSGQSGVSDAVLNTSRAVDPQRQALLNAVENAGTLSEKKGIVFAIRQMQAQGFKLLDESFRYRGNQGVDLVFKHKNTGQYAILEAKHGKGLASLKTYKGPLRQGGTGYNIDRLGNYIRFNNNANVGLAEDLIYGLRNGSVDSYASFYRGNSLYKLDFADTVNFRLAPEAAIRVR